MFSIERILKRISKQKAFYFFLIVQLILGMSFLIYSLNGYFLQNDFFHAQSKHIQKEYTNIESNPRHAEAITLDDYLQGKANYAQKLTIHYIKRTSVSFLFSEKEGEIEAINITILFLNEEARNQLFSIKETAGKYLMGSGVKEKLALLERLSLQDIDGKAIEPKHYFLESDKMVIPLKEGLEIDGEAFCFDLLSQEVEVNLVPMSYDLADSISSSKETEHQLTLKDCVLIPLDESISSSTLWSVFPRSMETLFLVRDHDPEEGNLWHLLQDIYEAHRGEYTYHVNEEYLQARIVLQQMIDGQVRILSISLLQLAVVAFSSAAILYLFLQRRKGDIAISVMMGSRMKTQAFELVGEATCLVFLGSILSLFLYYIVGLFKEFDPIQWKTLGVLLAVSMGMIAISVSLALGELYHLSPVEILQKKGG